MKRRDFLSTSVAAGVAISAGRSGAADSDSPASRPVRKEVFTWDALGHPVVSGPAPESLVILQAVSVPSTGYVELAIGDGDFRRIDSEGHGLLTYDENVLKFVLPPLPPGQKVRYRIVTRSIDFKNDYDIRVGEPATSAEYNFTTLNPAAGLTRFIVWNDTHENQQTIQKLQALTTAFAPDYLLWNGDQTNNIHDAKSMREQFLAPGGLEISARWPMAYARGNHDVRGPAARLLPQFTGTPEDRFYYGFRSGPLAALVLDTGEDKEDTRPVFGGLAGFEPMRKRQTAWLAEAIEQPWFQSAPYRVLFCHIPLWWHEDPSTHEYWICSPVCREAWLPLLRKAGVQLVVSGHTHEATWMPPSSTQPIGQLIGGGPGSSSATIIEGTADGSQLTMTCKKLDGTLLHRVELKPIA